MVAEHPAVSNSGSGRLSPKEWGRQVFPGTLGQIGLPDIVTGLWLRSLETQPALCHPSGGALGEFLLPSGVLSWPPVGQIRPEARGQGDPRVSLGGSL